MATTAKQAARELIVLLPDQSSWDDIMYQLYVKQKIEEGLADISAGDNKGDATLSCHLPPSAARVDGTVTTCPSAAQACG